MRYYLTISPTTVVGYASQGIQVASGEKLYCLSIQFGDVQTDGGLTLNKLLSTVNFVPGHFETMDADAACAMFYNGADYDLYYYIGDAYDADGNEVTGWSDVYGDLIGDDDLRVVGEGYWLRIPADACTDGTLTQAGAVSGAKSITVDVAGAAEGGALTLIGNPFPTATDASKITVVGLEPGNFDLMDTNAPCMMFYNGADYDLYYYITDAYDADGNEVTGWADVYGDLVTEPIANTGAGFWIRCYQNGSLKFDL